MVNAACADVVNSILRRVRMCLEYAELAVADVVAVSEAYREGMAGNGAGVKPIVLVTGRFSRTPSTATRC